MKGREGKGVAPPADLLVCFPSRAHLSFMTPKRICSPARPSEPNKRRHHPHYNHQLRKSGTRGGGAGQASPLSWAKNKQIVSEISEPTSPKVTCAGQIKVRPKSSACKSWQSVMDEIERIHNHRKQKKRSNWVESLGLKKEIMQFLTCLRSIRFDLRCFGNFPRADITSEDDDDDEEPEEEVDEEYHESNENAEESDENSRTVFSKWYMVLKENQGHGFCKEERKSFDESEESVSASSVPPANALLLMRSRSAPAKSWLEEKEEQQVDEEIEEEEEEEEEMKEEKKSRDLRSLMEEEKKKNKDKLVVMSYNTDFYKLSSDIAKETWVVGGMRDLLSRSRSSKR